MTMQKAIPRLFLALIIAATAIWLAVNRNQLDVSEFEARIRSLGLLAPFAHVVLFAVGTVLFLPGALFGLAGGALFGPAWGTLVNLLGASLGATAAFLLGRYVTGDPIRRMAGGRLDRLVTGVEAEGWRFVAFVRLVPIFPFNLLNYALGLTRIPLASYVIASAVCMLPGTFAYTWLGHSGREALSGNDVALRYGLIGLGLIASVAFLPRLVRRLRSEPQEWWIAAEQLAEGINDGSETIIIDVRGAEEFSGPLGHIREARNIPVDALPSRFDDLRGLKDKSVILVCHTDKRSARAAALLSEAGFRNVRVLHGGMVRWHEAGLPVADRQ